MTGGGSGASATCMDCGSPLRANAPFCSACGQAMTARQVVKPGQTANHAAAQPYSPAAGSAARPSTIVVAERRVRCAAFLLDVAVLLSPAVPLALVAAVLGVAAVVYVVTPVAVVAGWLWMLIWQGLTGRTFGKAMLGLRAIRASDQRPPGFLPSAARSLLFVASAGLAALPVVADSLPHDGWHDRLTGITIIDISLGANPLGPRQRTALRARIDRSLKQVRSPVPTPGTQASPHATTGHI